MKPSIMQSAVATLACVALPGASALADDGSGRAAAFQAVDGPPTEGVPGGALMVAAYGFVWLALLGWLALVALRAARTERELHDLHTRLDPLLDAQNED